jgi:TRAP-type C4-dicarboxylate transport system permease small subunit
MLLRLTAALERAAYALTGTLLAATTLIIGWQVFSRKVLHSTPYWSEELARFAMVWMGLVGAALGVTAGAHITVDYFARLMGPRAARALAIFGRAAQALFGIFLLAYGSDLCLKFMGETSPAMRIPMGLIYIAVPLTGALMLLFVAAHRETGEAP